MVEVNGNSYKSEQKELTHLNKRGEAHMVDVGDKTQTSRQARAQAQVRMQPATMDRLMAGEMPKGDVLAVVRTAGIMAAKKTPDLIPLCHTLLLSSVTLDISQTERDLIVLEAEVSCTGQTGVEMEALTAVSVAALTLYDMCKAIDRGITIENIQLLSKTGGKSGQWSKEKVKEQNG